MKKHLDHVKYTDAENVSEKKIWVVPECIYIDDVSLKTKSGINSNADSPAYFS